MFDLVNRKETYFTVVGHINKNRDEESMGGEICLAVNFDHWIQSFL